MVTVIKSTSASDKMRAAVKAIASKKLRVGWFDTSQYQDGTPVAYVATIHEFGNPAGGVPARPFMRPTIEAKTPEWKSTLAGGAHQVLNGRLTAEQMLGQVGQMAAGNIAETIASIDTPALQPGTIKARESRRISPGVSTKPLVDTGLLIQSVNHKVEDV